MWKNIMFNLRIRMQFVIFIYNETDLSYLRYYMK